jgi:hypothetical protein
MTRTHKKAYPALWTRHVVADPPQLDAGLLGAIGPTAKSIGQELLIDHVASRMP